MLLLLLLLMRVGAIC